MSSLGSATSEDASEIMSSSDTESWTKNTDSSRSYTPSNSSTISSNTSTQSTQTDQVRESRRTHEDDMWYSGKCFDRYWKHYYRVMDWCQKHKHAFKTVNKQFCNSISRENEFSNLTSIYSHMHHPYSEYNDYYKQYYGSLHEKQSPRGGMRERGRKCKTQQKESRTMLRNSSSSLSDKATDLNSSSSTHQSEEFEMQITDEMLNFFAHSLKHRQERDAVKKEQDAQPEKEIERRNIEDVDKNEPTVEAPKERPGARRTAEMKEIYGKGAAMVHGMETALQMTYDRNADIKQPKQWPNMPLKLTFD